ncbi:H-2 class II histocompatibility antigen gamma chain-like [Parasteatoda tepidariorum]|uniref:H-2 class II histocompatibility antigen gamma chain-like n=1 Tax=Parasteatoda tepidariorum TaxID=114398 RepID=UPI00077FE176|nr:equistatin-like [Parasteatoda tepidariorum]
MKAFYVLLVLSLIAAAMSATPSACRLQRKMVKDAGDKKAFMPRCEKNGDYAPIQCRDGWCWCADKNGNMLGKSQKGKPDCKKH